MKPKRLTTERQVENTTIWLASCQSAPGVFRAMMLAVTVEGDAKRISRQSSSISRKPIHTARGRNSMGSSTSLPAVATASSFL